MKTKYDVYKEVSQSFESTHDDNHGADPYIKETAYHEAAHAVIAWHHGRPLNGASIRRIPGEAYGAVFSYTLYNAPGISIHEVEKDIDILLAGRVAEDIFIEREDAGCGWYDDFVKVLDAAEIIYEKENDDLLDTVAVIKGKIADNADIFYILSEYGQVVLFYLAHHVINLLKRDHIQACVKAVATALLEKTELDGDELCSIISDTWTSEKGEEKEDQISAKREQETSEREWGQWGEELLENIPIDELTPPIKKPIYLNGKQ